jgi:hypothetical protein
MKFFVGFVVLISLFSLIVFGFRFNYSPSILFILSILYGKLFIFYMLFNKWVVFLATRQLYGFIDLCAIAFITFFLSLVLKDNIKMGVMK